MDEEIRKLNEKMEYFSEDKKQQQVHINQIQKENEELQGQLSYEKNQANENEEVSYTL